MKCVKYALIAALVGTSAIAADLPSKDMPKAPTMPTLEDTSWYAGVALGGVKTDSSWYNNARLTASFGYEMNSFARVEGTLDYKHNNRSDDRTFTGMVNGIGQMKVPFIPVVPYALAGVGYRVADVKNEPVWNVGGGVRYEITSNIEIDGRYRYLSDMNRKRDENIFSVGVNYKF
jgi:opacity protein-like surface antigen